MATVLRIPSHVGTESGVTVRSDLAHDLSLCESSINTVDAEHNRDGSHNHIHASRVSLGGMNSAADGEAALVQIRFSNGYVLTAALAASAVNGASIATQAAADALAAKLAAQQAETNLQSITVNGVTTSVIPSPSAVPISDANGIIDPAWIPDVYSLTVGLSQQAVSQFNMNERLIAAGV